MQACEMQACEVHAHKTPAHQIHARGMHAREVQINHKRPYVGGRLDVHSGDDGDVRF